MALLNIQQAAGLLKTLIPREKCNWTRFLLKNCHSSSTSNEHIPYRMRGQQIFYGRNELIAFAYRHRHQTDDLLSPTWKTTPPPDKPGKAVDIRLGINGGLPAVQVFATHPLVSLSPAQARIIAAKLNEIAQQAERVAGRARSHG